MDTFYHHKLKIYVQLSKERQDEIKNLMLKGICKTWYEAYDLSDSQKLTKYIK